MEKTTLAMSILVPIYKCGDVLQATFTLINTLCSFPNNFVWPI